MNIHVFVFFSLPTQTQILDKVSKSSDQPELPSISSIFFFLVNRQVFFFKFDITNQIGYQDWYLNQLSFFALSIFQIFLFPVCVFVFICHFVRPSYCCLSRSLLNCLFLCSYSLSLFFFSGFSFASLIIFFSWFNEYR